MEGENRIERRRHFARKYVWTIGSVALSVFAFVVIGVGYDLRYAGPIALSAPLVGFVLAVVAIVRGRPVYCGVFALGLSVVMFVAAGVSG